MTLGLDYAGGRPGGAAIAAAGYTFVCRYLTDGGPGLPGKLLTPAEYADLMAAGVAVVLNWETTADRMKAGYAAGVADANAAGMQALTLGHPSDRPIYFSADFDASPADQAEIDDYLRGAISVIGASRVGVYGSYYVCQRCLNNGTATWAWQTAAWSGGQREPRAHLYQRIGTVTVGGVDCDVNESAQADFGQHPTGDDMNPDQDAILRDIWSQLSGDAWTNPPKYEGWPARPDLTDAPKTIVDYVRAIHAALAALPAMVDDAVAKAIAAHTVDVAVTVANKTQGGAS